VDLEALNYELPSERIATEPAEPRDAAGLMVCDRNREAVTHHQVRDLPELELLQPGDLLVLNRSQVLPAALSGWRGQTGGRVQGLFLGEPEAGQWRLMLESRGKLTAGERIELGADAALELLAATGPGQWQVRVLSERPTQQLLQAVGATPLPPYIRKARRAQHLAEVHGGDPGRYNTVFAAEPGSLAAPTAGLHFTSELLQRLEAQGIGRAELTLHVGIGTFTPIRSETVEAHHMHEEWIDVPAATIEALRATRAAGRRIVPIGTTSVRALESLPELTDCPNGYAGYTDLFIHPEANFHFRFTDALMTNFHLPRSTLLAMVAALPGVGLKRLKQWYQIAIDEHYRFYSYGDAMLIW